MASKKMPRVSQKKVQAAIDSLNGVRRDWLRRPGVTAVDVGYKISNSKMTGELALRMHVRRKLPAESLEGHDLVTSPDKPQKVGDFSIDVIEADYGPSELGGSVIEAADVDRLRRVDPLVGGVSVGNLHNTTGTLGAIVWDRGTGEPAILSNWHVLCGHLDCTRGDPILQPSTRDGGRSDHDQVAELTRSILDKDVDAALARLTGQRGFTRDLLELTPTAGIASPRLGMEVSKSGRSTGVTRGIIDGVGLSFSLSYRSGITQSFENQIHIVPRPPWPEVDDEISSGGDSGSVWIEESSGKAVGLHFAGETSPSPQQEHAVANRMETVAEKLNISFSPVFRADADDDERLREVIERNLCRRFPFLCLDQPVDVGSIGQQADPTRPGMPTCRCCGSQLPQTAAPVSGRAAVARLVDEIVAELRRAR